VSDRPRPPIAERLERASRDASSERYLLKLYVSGMTPRSTRAVECVRMICDRYVPGGYDLEVVDIYQQPHLARDDQIVAAPTLVKCLPLPIRRVIGDLSSTDRVLLGLDLRQA
jgi:circadian clock protein KaiB